MSFTAEELNIGEVYPTGLDTTNNQQYFEPLRLDIEWWDMKHLELLHSFSSWNPKGLGVSNHVPVISASVTPPGANQYGGFTFRVWDTDHVIELSTVRRKTLIIMKAKKYQNQAYQNLMYGFTTGVDPQTVKNQLYYEIKGAGSGIVLNERLVNINKTARMKSIDSDIPMFDDELMAANRLFKDLLTVRDDYVVNDFSIAEQFNPPMDTSPLDISGVTDTILSLNEPGVQASHTLNAILDGIGADGGIDVYNRPYLTYPLSRTPALTLKAWDSRSDSDLDRADSMAYFMDDWSYSLDWSQESGFANRLHAKVTVTSGSSTASTTGSYGGFEDLKDRDLGQLIPASPTKFRDISLILSRVGQGTINPNTKNLDGRIIEDNGGTPTGPHVASFQIPLASIPEDNPSPMFLMNLTFKRDINAASGHWIILYERGNPDQPDTINWYFNTSEDLTGHVARRPNIAGAPWRLDRNNNSGWEVTENNSFNFGYSILDSFVVPLIAEDVESQDRYGIIEDNVDLQWAKNIIAANKILHEMLAIRCLPKATYKTNKVTIPNNLYMPGMIVRIEHEQSGITSSEGTMAEIVTASYNFGGGLDNQLGASSCDLSLVGHYDFRLHEEEFIGGVEV